MSDRSRRIISENSYSIRTLELFRHIVRWLVANVPCSMNSSETVRQLPGGTEPINAKIRGTDLLIDAPIEMVGAAPLCHPWSPGRGNPNNHAAPNNNPGFVGSEPNSALPSLLRYWQRRVFVSDSMSTAQTWLGSKHSDVGSRRWRSDRYGNFDFEIDHGPRIRCANSKRVITLLVLVAAILLAIGTRPASADYSVAYAIEIGGLVETGSLQKCDFDKICATNLKFANLFFAALMRRPSDDRITVTIYGRRPCCYFSDGRSYVDLYKQRTYRLDVFEGRARHGNEFIQNYKIGTLSIAFQVKP